ncbi:MAG: ribonuclease R family protein [Gammaproteobacteria bacterium WSBS_2016_MAG_OTU1]
MIDGVVEKSGFPTKFSAALNQAAQHAINNVATDSSREDFRRTDFFTIDGADARDFDDAVYCTEAAGGSFRLLVAIADVAAFVLPNSALDVEAQKRGNSVYLPDRVLPMLPAALSDDVCSLRVDEDKFCLVCEMQIRDGEVQQYRFVRGIMRSKQRFTYEQATAEMNKNVRVMKNLAAVARQLRQKRRDNGAFMMERPEGQVCIEENKVRLQLNARTEAHIAIEECMIATNCCAADFLIRRHLPALHRIHKKPSADGVRKLKQTLKSLNIDFPQRPQAADFGEVMEKITAIDETLANCLTPVVLGALSRAEYAADEKTGHFGLACSRYLHFTSPIRRYPDLLTHRAILAGLASEKITFTELRQIGAHCSQTEITADKAGWECRQRLLCWQAQKHVGLEFDAVISGAVHFGIFVSVAELGVDGMLKLSSLPGYWRHNEETNQFVHSKSGTTLGLGSHLRLRLAAVSAEKGRADFELVKNHSLIG